MRLQKYLTNILFEILIHQHRVRTEKGKISQLPLDPFRQIYCRLGSRRSYAFRCRIIHTEWRIFDLMRFSGRWFCVLHVCVDATELSHPTVLTHSSHTCTHLYSQISSKTLNNEWDTNVPTDWLTVYLSVCGSQAVGLVIVLLYCDMCVDLFCPGGSVSFWLGSVPPIWFWSTKLRGSDPARNISLAHTHSEETKRKLLELNFITNNFFPIRVRLFLVFCFLCFLYSVVTLIEPFYIFWWQCK